MSKKTQTQTCLICGIDEAGRGPVVGPLVMARVCIESLKIPKLIKMGVKDSKALSSAHRRKLHKKLFDLCDTNFIAVPPPRIDKWVQEKEGLNALEAFTASKLLTPIQKEVKMIFIDSPSTPKSFTNYLKKFGVNLEKVIAESKADKKRPVVSAASIIAKEVRDQRIEEITKEMGFPIGSGYPSSPKTRQALKRILKKRPQYVRRSWKTVEKLGLHAEPRKK